MERKVREYKSFFNVIRDAVYTDKQCQFCGEKKDCLEGGYFGDKNLKFICLSCLDGKKAGVNVP